MFILCTFPPHLFRNIMYLATNAKSTFFCKVFYSIISLYKRCMLCYRAHLLLPAPSVQLFPSFVGEAHNELNWNLPFHFFFTFLSTTHTHKFFSCHSCHTALKKKALLCHSILSICYSIKHSSEILWMLMFDFVDTNSLTGFQQCLEFSGEACNFVPTDK